MRENFALACGFVLKHEGGYSNDPNDPGGETNFGISKRYHPNVDIKNLTERGAAEIYLKEYWLPTCDNLPFPNDFIYFDTFVNMGRDDANEAIAGTVTWEEFLFNRIAAYVDKVRKSPNKLRYVFGWLSRCLDLYRAIKAEQRAKTHD
jgi:hypothetical protein